MKTIAQRATLARSTLEKFLHHRSYAGTARVEAPRIQVNQGVPELSGWKLEEAQTPEVSAQGVIRREEIPLLTHYGSAYGLFNEWIADYECVLTSDTYRLGEYVGDSVWIAGLLTNVSRGMPVIEVTYLQLLKKKWMR